MSKSKKIVLVEDNPDLSNVLREMLTNKGYTVSVAETVEAGVLLVQDEKPDLLLLDTILPGINGIEVLDQLQAYRAGNPLKVLMLSNIDDPNHLKDARSHDIEEYLIKTDWRMEDVLARIKKYI